MVESRGKRILMMAASATRIEELWRKLQLKYEIPIYAVKPNFRKYLSNTNYLNSNLTNYCHCFISEIRKQTVSHQGSGNFL